MTPIATIDICLYILQNASFEAIIYYFQFQNHTEFCESAFFRRVRKRTVIKCIQRPTLLNMEMCHLTCRWGCLTASLWRALTGSPGSFLLSQLAMSITTTTSDTSTTSCASNRVAAPQQHRSVKDPGSRVSVINDIPLVVNPLHLLDYEWLQTEPFITSSNALNICDHKSKSLDKWKKGETIIKLNIF